MHINIKQRIAWLSQRMTLEGYQKDYIEMQMKEAVLEAVEQVKNIGVLADVSGSYLPKCNRVEVIDKYGRSYTNYDCKSVETQMQDDDKTLKVFIS